MCTARHTQTGIVTEFTTLQLSIIRSLLTIIEYLYLDQCLASTPVRLPPTFETVNSPLDWSQWESCLAGHPDWAYRVNGFQVGYDYSRYLRFVVHQATCSGKNQRSSVNTWHTSVWKAECWVLWTRHCSCLFTPVASASFRKAHWENGD